MKVLVYGAGVIGRVYAARLQGAGNEVTLVARGADRAMLDRDGVVLVTDIDRTSTQVSVVEHPVGHFDLMLVAVRCDQLLGALPALNRVDAGIVLFLQNLLETREVSDLVGSGRVLFGFPGIGGYRTIDGAVRYVEIAQQPTTIGHHHGVEESVCTVLRAAGFRVVVTDHMSHWLKVHAVFIAAFGSAVNAHGGDSTALAQDVGAMKALVQAVREGFVALQAQGVPVTPRALKVIFMTMPGWFAVRYWSKQLRSEVGTIAMAPHMYRSQDNELAQLCLDVRSMLDGGRPTPALQALLAPTS